MWKEEVEWTLPPGTPGLAHPTGCGIFANGSKPALSWASREVRAEMPCRSHTKSRNRNPSGGLLCSSPMPQAPGRQRSCQTSKAKLRSAMGAPFAGTEHPPRGAGEKHKLMPACSLNTGKGWNKLQPQIKLNLSLIHRLSKALV